MLRLFPRIYLSVCLSIYLSINLSIYLYTQYLPLPTATLLDLARSVT